MSGQWTVRSAVFGRVAIGVLAAAAALLLSPVAAATPESDANDAINAAYDAGGGDTGPLGPRDGDVYAVGPGFGQNFAGGKIYFTPATGAHIMTGAILDKFDSLGGPADSDLGFPTIDEGAGRAPDSRNTTFSAADNPVIFWTPATGARVVRGPINAAWDKLGGSAGTLGVPTEDETYDGDVVSQAFTGGELSYDTKKKTFTTVPPDLAGQLTDLTIPEDPISAINAARRAAGGPLGPLGAPDGAVYKIGADGFGQNFAGGKIFYSPATGANVVTGQVLAKYDSVGGPEGDLGFPTGNEADGGAPNSRVSTFAAKDQPLIFWTPDYGAVIVRGAMNAAWQKLGGATGDLGAPMADQTENGEVITQRFAGGAVSWDASTKKFSTEPANLASGLAGLDVPSQDLPKATNGAQAANDNGNNSSHGTWWWLLAIVPILLLVGLVAFAAVHRRRRRAGDSQAVLDDSQPFDAGRVGAPGNEEGDDRTGQMFGDRYARQGLGSLSPASTWGTHDTATEADTTQTAVTEAEEDPDKVDTAPTRIEKDAADVDAADAQSTDVETADVQSADEESEFDTAAVRSEFDTADGTNETDIAEAIRSISLGASPRPERDPLTDTGRHARIVIDEPEPVQTALRLPLDDPNQAPDGYPIKADTKSGLYWAPGSALYDDARAEIWFASEEFAITNGFVRGD